MRLAAVLVLALALFVVTVCSAPREEPSETITKPTNGSEPRKNGTETSLPPVKPPSNEQQVTELKQNKTESAESVEQVASVSDDVVKVEPLRNRTHCHSEKEQYDMTNCFASPHDGEDEDDGGLSNSTESAPAIDPDRGVAGKVPEAPGKLPETPGKVPDAEVDPKAVDKLENWLKKTKYDTAPERPEQTELPKNSSVSETSSGEPKQVNNSSSSSNKQETTTETPVSSVAPLLVGKVRSIEAESLEDATKSSERTEEDKRMPSGIIALVTAVTFAILIIIGYISMVAWRRYLEYRYGHRELLVNDLEFDTNDLRHFEL